MSCLRIGDLTVTFRTPHGPLRAVDGVSISHLTGETLVLMGETGCGKSVIASSILRLLPSNARVEGRIILNGRDILSLGERELADVRGKEVGLIFQNPSLALNPIQRVGKQITEPLIIHQRIRRNTAWLAALDLLERLRFKTVESNSRKYPFQLSGGMNQRILIAASMILNPKVLIADEPTKGLDSALKKSVIEEFRYIKKMKDSSLLIITHDFELTEALADRVAIMYGGQIVEIALKDDFFSAPLHPYSIALMKSLPKNGFHPIPGAPVSFTNPSPGCRFYMRCPDRRNICNIERPSNVSIKHREVQCLLYR